MSKRKKPRLKSERFHHQLLFTYELNSDNCALIFFWLDSKEFNISSFVAYRTGQVSWLAETREANAKGKSLLDEESFSILRPPLTRVFDVASHVLALT